MPHGPHSTKTGCKPLVLWTERMPHENADLRAFFQDMRARGLGDPLLVVSFTEVGRRALAELRWP